MAEKLSINDVLRRAIQAHNAGKIREADLYYTAILKVQPEHPDANHNIGVLAVDLGKIEDALPYFKRAIKENETVEQYWVSYIDALIKLKETYKAKEVCLEAGKKGINGDKITELKDKIFNYEATNSFPIDDHSPPLSDLKALEKFYNEGEIETANINTKKLLQDFPKSTNLYNILGAVNKTLGNYDKSLEAYKKIVSLNPLHADAYNNIGTVLQLQDKLQEAIAAYIQAINIKADFAEPYHNMGLALQKCGELQEAIAAYENAIKIKPTYIVAYYGLGTALQESGNLEEATKVYNKALKIDPNNAEIHRILSLIKTYDTKDPQILQVYNLYKNGDITNQAKCNLCFALAKMYEDTNQLDKAYKFLTEGNKLRKKIFNYKLENDEKLFGQIKKVQPKLKLNTLTYNEIQSDIVPIFIIGMPRSGTTLVEQIISSHSKVEAGGELNYVGQYGAKLATGEETATKRDIFEFRKKYLGKLSHLSNQKNLVTDKMPENFKLLPVICAAIPEAKVVHVKRDAAATCWSNFKTYFATDSLGYSYDLEDVISYYNLYADMVQHWTTFYNDKIYTLDYEKLVSNEECEIRSLIEYLNLDWENNCLYPQKNNRIVRTASQQQVNEKIYAGSSNNWRKYEKYLRGKFDDLPRL